MCPQLRIKDISKKKNRSSGLRNFFIEPKKMVRRTHKFCSYRKTKMVLRTHIFYFSKKVVLRNQILFFHRKKVLRTQIFFLQKTNWSKGLSIFFNRNKSILKAEVYFFKETNSFRSKIYSNIRAHFLNRKKRHVFLLQKKLISIETHYFN